MRLVWLVWESEQGLRVWAGSDPGRVWHCFGYCLNSSYCPLCSCLGQGRLVLGTDPAHCLSQAHGDLMALKCPCHQDWVKVAGGATHCQGHMAGSTASQASSWWEMQLKHLTGYLYMSVSRPGLAAAGLPGTRHSKMDRLVFPGSSYLHP